MKLFISFHFFFWLTKFSRFYFYGQEALTHLPACRPSRVHKWQFFFHCQPASNVYAFFWLLLTFLSTLLIGTKSVSMIPFFWLKKDFFSCNRRLMIYRRVVFWVDFIAFHRHHEMQTDSFLLFSFKEAERERERFLRTWGSLNSPKWIMWNWIWMFTFTD